MFYASDANDHGLPYNPIKACVVPRPIGWISTISAAGVVNLAPYSFFNVLSYDPAYVTFSAGSRPEDGGIKDSVINAEATGEFVYNMATWAQRLQMTETALITDRGTDEMAAAGLDGLPSRLVRPPRVKGSPVHFECVHHCLRAGLIMLARRYAGLTSPRLSSRMSRARSRSACAMIRGGPRVSTLPMEILKPRPRSRQR